MCTCKPPHTRATHTQHTDNTMSPETLQGPAGARSRGSAKGAVRGGRGARGLHIRFHMLVGGCCDAISNGCSPTHAN